MQRGQRVAISICDGTRPQPRHVVVPALLEELEGRIADDDIVVLVATGTHRGNSPAELEAMLGAEVLRRVRVVNHDARDDASPRWVGELAGDVPVWLNREWLDADVRITTGFVEPHFFAGFSGGPKMVAPGLAGLSTVLALHNARRIGDERATWAITIGNPVHDAVRAIAEATASISPSTSSSIATIGSSRCSPATSSPSTPVRVTGPLGTPVLAAWRMDVDQAVIETAQASGIGLVGGPDGNEPLRAVEEVLTAAHRVEWHRTFRRQ